MGHSILEYVLRLLRQERFAADVAYPGQKFPRITDPVAAVHIEKVDRANMTVTVEISIIVPAAMGGTTCEMEALRATEVLRWNGAVCVQNGCTYDGVAQVYVVQILATFTGVTEAENCTLWPGFYCYVDDVMHHHAIAFESEYVNSARLEYSTGEALPVRSSPGSVAWNISMEELVPSGAPEIEDTDGEFVLDLVTQWKAERFTGCRWTSIQRQFAKQGMKRISKGFARTREEVADAAVKL